MCFLWCILAHLYPVSDGNSNRVSKYQNIEHDLDVKGFSWPMKIEDISKFEKRNNISVNVYGLNDSRDKILPVRISDYQTEKERCIDMLFINTADKCHYVVIKKLVKAC